MEAQWIIDRAKLRELLQTHPEWTNRQYAEATGRCRKWVKKWKKRLANSAPNDQKILEGQSRARKIPHEPYHPDVIEKILELRDHPPPAVPRRIGAPTIVYYLHQDETLAASGHRLPRSTSTIWKILNENQRILRPVPIKHEPFERPEAMDTWEIDFTDVGTAEASHDHKRAHQVEAFAVVDRGSSVLVDLQVSDNYHAVTAIEAMLHTLMQHGKPRCIVFDRDPRLVGSWTATGFPSAFMRFLLNLDIQIDICPPHRPDLKPFVERYFRTLNSECVQIHCPATVAEAQTVFEKHRHTYNHLRPHQSKVCNNRPPLAAFPDLPSLPKLLSYANPDKWLLHYHHQRFKRRIARSGTVQIDKHRYYIGRALAGQYVVCKLDAQRRVFDIHLDHVVIKSIPIKGLYNDDFMDFGDYLEFALLEAETEQRRLERQRYRKTGG